MTPGWSPRGKVPVYFDADSVPMGGTTAFPLRKLGMLADFWAAHRSDTVEFMAASPVTRNDLLLVHDADYVDGILSGRVRNPITGSDPSGARSAMLDVGAFVAAARSAAASGWFAAVIGGGFHHAGPSRSNGFSTFNGLMVAAGTLIRDGLAKRVGILDLDAHHGEGTQSIVNRVPWADSVDHYSFAHELLDPHEVDDWTLRLPARLARMKDEGVEIVLYNAGVDPHVGDRMIRGVMTTEQMAAREHAVFGTCLALGMPLAWTTAGGYQKRAEDAVALHDLAMAACVAAMGLDPAARD